MQSQAHGLQGSAGARAQRQHAPTGSLPRPVAAGAAPLPRRRPHVLPGGLTALSCRLRPCDASSRHNPSSRPDGAPQPSDASAGQVWLSRAGGALAAAAVAVSLLAGSAGADTLQPVARMPAEVRVRDEPSGSSSSSGGSGGGVVYYAHRLRAGGDSSSDTSNSSSSSSPGGLLLLRAQPAAESVSGVGRGAMAGGSDGDAGLQPAWHALATASHSTGSNGQQNLMVSWLRQAADPQAAAGSFPSTATATNQPLVVPVARFPGEPTDAPGPLSFSLPGSTSSSSSSGHIPSFRVSEPHRAHPALTDEGDEARQELWVGPRGSAAGPRGQQALSETASETEDRLLLMARRVEARLEAMLGGALDTLPPVSDSTDASAPTKAAHALIREVWEVVDANYLDARSTGFNRDRWAELRDEALAGSYRDTAAGYRAVRDMLARGLSDPYCRFIGPAELDAMKKYDVSGVGLNLGTAAEYVVKTGNELPAPRDPAAPGEGVYVVGVSRGSAADVAGIRQGDELLAIEGESLEESTPFRAAGLISGATEEAEADGTAAKGGKQRKEDLVSVKVRHGDGSVEQCQLKRPRRTLPSTVSTSLTRSAVALPGGGRGEEVVGTVRLAAFNARAQSDVAAAIRQLEAGGATRLVLDLRDNRGGLVTEGLEVARLFLDGDAPIVITERRDATPDTPLAPGPPLTNAPLLVLVNSHTASASEIVAGALHDNCRAVLAGGRTYGKGLIQSVYELSDGSGLVITVGKYLTPRGTDIDRYGIMPDYSSVPSNSQYDSAVKACRLTAPPVAAAAGVAVP
ncbi:hypothetical protein HXX76_005138 [Chlamydomonas incerta]|uniref:PDZ domain-containing protein n=1 Tax=Chlamydomonas incerta TaxID=51695 RepID=A0A835T8Y8_CHLIN|nr:hypothetical protein HXX76_005138 [Chlamydomonas incerta]|eukprot:KAG2438588.1 hypothetical protein HXX76_005138 [Chlamydomonas incerta]